MSSRAATRKSSFFACTGILLLRHQGRSESKRFTMGSEKSFPLQFSQFRGKSAAIHPLLPPPRSPKKAHCQYKRILLHTAGPEPLCPTARVHPIHPRAEYAALPAAQARFHGSAARQGKESRPCKIPAAWLAAFRAKWGVPLQQYRKTIL